MQVVKVPLVIRHDVSYDLDGTLEPFTLAWVRYKGGKPVSRPLIRPEVSAWLEEAGVGLMACASFREIG